MKKTTVGTLIRCADVNERRIAFYREIGLEAIQIAGVYEPWLDPGPESVKASDDLFRLFRKYEISVPSMFLSFPNQDWNHPKEGIGLVPEKTRAERMLISCRLMNWAKKYGIPSVSCHVGFVPEEENDFFERLISDLRQLAKFAAANGQEFLFETGTEKVGNLKRTLDRIAEPNVGINFDPANLLWYNNDDPSVLLDQLSSRIRIVHCKDAVRPKPGEVHGKETVLGHGGTRFADLLKRLAGDGFNGPLIIERELAFGPEQEKDVTEAVKFIKSILKGE